MSFDAKRFTEEKLQEIRDSVKEGTAIVATSGGVDSSVCAVLAHRALGDRAIVVFIDDGLMREGEPERVITEFKNLGARTKLVDAQDDFFEALKGIEDPEEKRKAFRDIFYKTLGKVVKESSANWMIQGTIKADILETEGGIKTQHNILEQIGISPSEYGLQILEPLKDLFKPDVREVGKALGLPEEMHQRMPFPGPGLATRVIGEVTPERVAVLRKATTIVEEELKELKPFQGFAVLLNDKATGVVNKKRTFGNIIVIRSVESQNALTAEVTRIPWNILEKIQQQIITEIPSVTKVLFDITPKPPSTIEYI